MLSPGADDEVIFDVITAIQEGEYDVIRQAITTKLIGANARDQDNCTLLHWAAINNRVAIAQFLVEHDADVNAVGGLLGETPIHWAIRKKYYAMINLLVQRGADLAHKSNQGLDAVHIALRTGSGNDLVNTLFLLLHSGANPNIVDSDGNTPVTWLMKNRLGRELLRPLQVLIRFGADVNHKDREKQNTALHLAVLTRDMDFRAAFCIHQADINVISIKNADGLTPWNVSDLGTLLHQPTSLPSLHNNFFR
jgi:palmitoyltransferase ZDHHC13/17